MSEVVKFGDLKSSQGGNSKQGFDDGYVPVTAVLNMELLIERFEWDQTRMGKPRLLIYTQNRGIISTTGGVLMKQARAIEREAAGKVISVKILKKESTKSKDPYGSPYINAVNGENPTITKCTFSAVSISSSIFSFNNAAANVISL